MCHASGRSSGAGRTSLSWPCQRLETACLPRVSPAPLRCPLCITDIRERVVAFSNDPATRRMGAAHISLKMAGFDSEVIRITFASHDELVRHMIRRHGWRAYTGTLAQRSEDRPCVDQ